MEGFNVDGLVQTFSNLISTWGLSVVGAIAVLIIGAIVAKTLRAWTLRVLGRSKMDKTLHPFLSSLVYYAIMAFVLIAVLGLFGVPTASFIAVLGAAGLAVGLALQGTLSNFAAGVMLLVFRPFRVGDYIEAAGAEGTVKEISVFSSVLDTLDNTQVVLPNATIWGQTIKNFTANDTRRNDMVIGISYGDNIDTARRVILDVLKSDKRVLANPEPLIAVQELNTSSVDLLVGPWCHPDHYWDLRFDLFQTIKEELERGGCSIPFPQQDLHLIDVPKDLASRNSAA